MIARSNNHLGVITPSSTSPGAFVQAAADNIDINEETCYGKHTTHSTKVVLYQTGQFGTKQKRILCGDHSKKQRALETPVSCQTMLNGHIYGKKTFCYTIPHTDKTVLVSCQHLSR